MKLSQPLMVGRSEKVLLTIILSVSLTVYDLSFILGYFSDEMLMVNISPLFALSNTVTVFSYESNETPSGREETFKKMSSDSI